MKEHNMHRLLIILSLLVMSLAPLSTAAASSEVRDPDVLRQLAAVRRATAKYHDVSKAIADGYLPAPHCVGVPGVGGMGYHYVKPSLTRDLALDPLQPELLLYVPSGNGLRLVGVEYFVAAVGQPTPSLFGRPFDGPMPGHEPGMPTHYDLHVWLWQTNPNGIFAALNPNVEC